MEKLHSSLCQWILLYTVLRQLPLRKIAPRKITPKENFPRKIAPLHKISLENDCPHWSKSPSIEYYEPPDFLTLERKIIQIFGKIDSQKNTKKLRSKW